MARPNTRKTAQSKTREFTPIQAVAVWQTNIDDTLNKLNNPSITEAQKTKLKAHLKEVLKEAVEETQKQLMLKNSIMTADMLGVTKANTAWGRPDVVAKNPHAKLVNEYCQDILDEQAKIMKEGGAPVSKQELINADEQANDSEKDKIIIESHNAKEKGGCTIEVDKETGDASVYETTSNGDKKLVSVKRSWWDKTKSFCVFIWTWIKDTAVAAWNWIKSFFTKDELDSLNKAA